MTTKILISSNCDICTEAMRNTRGLEGQVVCSRCRNRGVVYFRLCLPWMVTHHDKNYPPVVHHALNDDLSPNWEQITVDYSNRVNK